MNTIASKISVKEIIPASLLDIMGLLVIYFIPTLSHMAGIPFYLFEPMRIFIILSLLHSGKINSLALAIGLPLFSFFISSHPVFVKVLLIGFELTLNVLVFYALHKKLATYWAVVLSVVFSKLVYYLLKYILIRSALLESSLISTPVYIQFFTTAIFGFYAFLWFRKAKKLS